MGPAVRLLREKSGLTQARLVAKLNLQSWDISRETLAKIESQVRWVSDFELLRLAEALAVAPGELLSIALKNQPSGQGIG